jgi:hypothetical protein
MPAYFDDAERLLSSVLGAFYNERVLITPMRRGLTAERDATRAPFEINGTLDESQSSRRPGGEGSNSSWTIGEAVSSVTTLAIEVCDLADMPEIKDGDRVTAIERDGAPVFEISYVVPLGVAERVFELAPIGRL